jgi:hypothetical protein
LVPPPPNSAVTPLCRQAFGDRFEATCPSCAPASGSGTGSDFRVRGNELLFIRRSYRLRCAT